MTDIATITEETPARPRRHPEWLRVAIGSLFICVLVLAGLFAPLPYDPLEPYLDDTLVPPGSAFWFGTDSLGRDIFSRTIAGARVDIPLALAGTLVSLVVGVSAGLLASTKSRWSDRTMRALDMFQAFPLLVLAIAIVALTGNKLHNVVFAIAFLNIPRFIRLVRSEALALRESRFIEAAYAIGASRLRVMVRHLLPNMTGTILVQASLTAAQAIIVIAALSFLGIGVTPPDAKLGCADPIRRTKHHYGPMVGVVSSWVRGLSDGACP